MKNTLMKYSFLLVIAALTGVCSGAVLLNDTFADGSREETNLPSESAVWVSHPARIAMDVGSLAFTQDGSSTKMWTYFAPYGSPATLEIGDKLIATVEFTPTGMSAMSNDNTNRTFRFGLFHDPTDEQLLLDTNTDDGGSGRWFDSRGYAVQFNLSTADAAAQIRIGKRTAVDDTFSLLGNDLAYTFGSNGERVKNLVNGTAYTLTLTLERTGEAVMKVGFAFSEGENVIATASLTDPGLGSLPIYTAFDQLFFRISSTTGTAEVLDYHSIKIEHTVSVEESPYEGFPAGTYYPFPAVESCRTEVGPNRSYVNQNRQDSSKLTVRGDTAPAKSWIKFNLGSFEPNSINLKAAMLSVTLMEERYGTVEVSAVNNNYLTNSGWLSGDITWNNAPGNDPDSDGQLNASQTTFIGTIDIIQGTNDAVGTTHSIDVTDIVKADTDGIIQFVLHNGSNLINFSTHNHSTVEWRPVLTLIEAPAGADYPRPYYGSTVKTDLAELSWVNPEPNDLGATVSCTVYLGTEPNRLVMDWVPLAAGVSSVAINTDMFENFGDLQNLTTYYWAVDCFDTSAGVGLLEGLMWWFRTDDNKAPLVSAGADQAVWLGEPNEVTVTLYGVTSDDGLPGPTYTVKWTQVANDAPTVTIDNDDQDTASVTFTKRGVYVFRLTADDGEKQASDTVIVYVGTTPCDASHMNSGTPYLGGDVNRDCIVNLEDVAIMAAGWLDCTDTQDNCGME